MANLGNIGSFGSAFTGKLAQGAMLRRQMQQEEKQMQLSADAMKYQQESNAITTAFNIAQKSANPNDTFLQIYKKLYPEGDLQSIDLSLKDQAKPMTFNYKDFMFKGKQEQILQAMNIIQQNPEKGDEIIDQLVNLGLAEITIPKEKKADEWSKPYEGPGGSMLQRNEATGEVRSVVGRAPAGGVGTPTIKDVGALGKAIDDASDEGNQRITPARLTSLKEAADRLGYEIEVDEGKMRWGTPKYRLVKKKEGSEQPSEEQIKDYLIKAGGNKERARELARKDGYEL